MPDSHPSRRDVLRTGAAAFAAGLTMITNPDFVFPAAGDDEQLVPFLNTPRTGPNRLDWETLDEWLTPQDQVFSVQHYGVPEFNPDEFALEIAGMVEQPQTLTLDDIRKLPRQDQHMTLECSGNGASPGFMNAIYNSRWTGTPLAPLLKKSGIHDDAIEVVFIGYDRKEETLRPGTKRELNFEVPFGRSMSIEDALNLPLLLAYERNGEPLEKRNGAPLRLIVPGWYGIANVKWLRRIEIRNRRYMGRYMARDYVTVRAEKRGDDVEFVETSVGRMNLKSIVARVTRGETQNGKVPLKAYGAVWNNGTPIRSVEVKLNNGEWREAKIDAEPHEEYCWRFFSIDLGTVEPGKHTLVSRGIDATGRIQPSAEDDEIALKRTYWEAYQQWPREIEVEA
ncbi:MAG: molybdopterin-dependent oxidoreductase [Planctomycetota bacterium]|jgi:DMSO/TMAO reductase YedYZ molybdopterin-dependent catalytic subunit